MNNNNLEESEESLQLEESRFSIHNANQNGQNGPEKLIITKDQDNLNGVFSEHEYQTISEQSQLNDSYEPQKHDESQNIQCQNLGNQNKDDIKEITIFEIEKKMLLNIGQIKRILAYLTKCCSQDESSISTQISQLSKNKDVLKSMLALSNEEDLEIITMLIMLLIKQNPTPDFFLNKQDEQFDIHMITLFQIHTSYLEYCQEEGNLQNEDQVTAELEIILDKDFRSQLREKLDD